MFLNFDYIEDNDKEITKAGGTNDLQLITDVKAERNYLSKFNKIKVEKHKNKIIQTSIQMKYFRNPNINFKNSPKNKITRYTLIKRKTKIRSKKNLLNFILQNKLTKMGTKIRYKNIKKMTKYSMKAIKKRKFTNLQTRKVKTQIAKIIAGTQQMRKKVQE